MTHAESQQALGAIAREDVGNIVFMEHVNLFIPDLAQGLYFFMMGMGFTRDPEFVVGPEAMWVNVGRQQFHLPVRGVQRIPGHVGIVVPDLDALEQRLKAVEPKLAGTEFQFSRRDGGMSVVSPSGVQFRCHAPDEKAYGPMKLGIPYVEFNVRQGTAQGIAKFYTRVFGVNAHCAVEGDRTVARVQVGNHQHLRFRETTERLPEYDGHHIAIYVGQVSGAYGFLQSRGLLMEEMRGHQFRFKHIVDPDSGEKLVELEHEVRSMQHFQYGRVLVNRDPSLSPGGQRMNPVATPAMQPKPS